MVSDEKFEWMSFPVNGLCDDPENENFRISSG